MRFVSSVVDAIVLRHPGKGDVEKVALKSSKPVINAGDGIGEHPTQVKNIVQPFLGSFIFVFLTVTVSSADDTYTIVFLHRSEDQKKQQYDLWLSEALFELNRTILQYFLTFLWFVLNIFVSSYILFS